MVLKRYFRDYGFLFGLAGVVIALDQWTKWLVRSNLEMGEIWMPWSALSPYARIVHWYNTGVALGMFQDQSPLFAALAALVLIGIIYYFPQIPAKDWPLRLALGMMAGGAAGNMIDRLIVGHVTDFLSVGNFPVFNVADSSITVGVAVLILGVWADDRRARQLEKQRLAEEQNATEAALGETNSQNSAEQGPAD